jgi:hypothetical protein
MYLRVRLPHFWRGADQSAPFDQKLRDYVEAFGDVRRIGAWP